MRLALDAMGGDDAPRAMVQGALDYAATHRTCQVILVGRTPDIEACLARELGSRPRPDNIVIEHAPDVIGMAEKVTALREKPDDSMNVCARLVKAGKADAMVLCGNTGCSVGAAQIHLRRMPGVARAGIITPLPTPKQSTWVCDTGANSVCKPEWLVQFAELTACYVETTTGRKRPTVGVLSIGEEDEKGDELTHQTLDLLRRTDLNVIGNVEGNDIYTGEVDIVICDGFTGNVVLKTSEGVLDALVKILKQEIHASLRTKLGGLLMKPAFQGLRDRAHWSVVGGCPLVGVGGNTFIGHGRSNRVAVANALGKAALAVETEVMARLRERFALLSARSAGSAPAAV